MFWVAFGVRNGVVGNQLREIQLLQAGCERIVLEECLVEAPDLLEQAFVFCEQAMRARGP